MLVVIIKKKIIIFFSLGLIAVFLWRCASQQKIEYQFPANIPAHVKTEYTSMAVKGHVLYNIHCGNCHTRTIEGKKIIPDFDAAKLAGYEIRVVNPQHISHIEEDKLTTDDLVLISHFLNYKTKSGFNIKGEKMVQ